MMERILSTRGEEATDEELVQIGLHIRKLVLDQCPGTSDHETLFKALCDVLRQQYRAGRLSVDNLCVIAAHGIVFPSQGWRP
jgi:hypothetical protein